MSTCKSRNINDRKKNPEDRRSELGVFVVCTTPTIEDVNGDALGVFVRAPTDIGSSIHFLTAFYCQGTDQGATGDLFLVFIDVGSVTPLRSVLTDFLSVVKPVNVLWSPDCSCSIAGEIDVGKFTNVYSAINR
jgi:hypothetical protein